MFLPYAIAFSAILTTKGMYRLPVPRTIIAAFALQDYLPVSKLLPSFIDISPLANNKQTRGTGRQAPGTSEERPLREKQRDVNTRGLVPSA